MLTQTLYKNGNSVAVTIPRQYLDELHLKERAEVVVEKKVMSYVLDLKQNHLLLMWI